MGRRVSSRRTSRFARRTSARDRKPQRCRRLQGSRSRGRLDLLYLRPPWNGSGYALVVSPHIGERPWERMELEVTGETPVERPTGSSVAAVPRWVTMSLIALAVLAGD